MKQGDVTNKDILSEAGLAENKQQYQWYAGVAVRAYLGLPEVPEPPNAKYDDYEKNIITFDGTKSRDDTVIADYEEPGFLFKEAATEQPATAEITLGGVNSSRESLLDTLPDCSEVEPRIMRSHFARYDLNSVTSAIGKRQRAMLRQLADLFDRRSGKTLFYYYVVPHLCKNNYPPSAGETMTGQAADLWRFLEAPEA